MTTNSKGLIYYKLDSELHGYDGDETKNSGLHGEEIDGNFNFLRGEDIKEISFNENGTLYIKRNNGQILEANQIEKPESPDYDFKYDAENGTLYIVKPNQEVIELTGFKNSVKIYHDSTINGDGSKSYPLSLSNLMKTGFYRSAKKLINCFDKNEELPVEGNSLHDRYITKEKYNRFGKLYSLNGVNEISQQLEEINSEWHVPSKEEWDEILNVIDCEIPNHNSDEINVELGEFAGSDLKSNNYWKPIETGEVLSDDKYGFTIYPVGFCYHGRNFFAGFGDITSFWTTTKCTCNTDNLIKTFEFDSKRVTQGSSGNDNYLSVRLVKKFNGNNFNFTEEINGLTFTCIHIPGTGLIWTKENINFTVSEMENYTPNEWESFDEDMSYKYYINEWDGSKWNKYELQNGENIILHESENGEMHQWILINNELVDNIDILKREIGEDVDEECKHIIYGDNGLYFDGYFGEF